MSTTYFNQISAVMREFLDKGRSSSYTQYWDEYGYTVLGQGAFSTVIKHPDSTRDTVIKIGSAVNDAWLAFAVYSMIHPSVHLPSIVRIELYDRFYIVEMGKLYENTDTALTNKLLQCRDTYAAWSVVRDRIGEVAFNLESAMGIPDDCHSANVMQDADGNLVITDPYTRYNTEGMYGQLMPAAPQGKYSSTKVDANAVYNGSELARISAEAPIRTEQEVQTLRKYAKYGTAGRAARMARVLSPVRTYKVESPTGPDKDIGIAQLAVKHWAERINNVAPRLCADFRKLDERDKPAEFAMAYQGRNNIPAKASLQHRFLGDFVPVRNTDIPKEDAPGVHRPKTRDIRCGSEILATRLQGGRANIFIIDSIHKFPNI